MTDSLTPDRADSAVGAPTPLEPLVLGDQSFSIERPAMLKAPRAMAMLRQASGIAPEYARRMAAFRTTHREQNVRTLDRIHARVEFAGRPYIDSTGDLAMDEDGRLRLTPNPTDAITEAEWERAGHVFRVPSEPDEIDETIAMFDLMVDLAEQHVYKVLALFTLTNEQVKAAHRAGELTILIDQRVEWLEDNTYADEVLDLAAHVGRILDERFIAKARRLRGTLGKIMGATPKPTPTPVPTTTVEPATASETASSPTPTSTEPTTSSSPSSSTGSAASTPDGGPTTSSTPTTTSSSSSTSSSLTTEPSSAPPTAQPLEDPTVSPTPPTSDPIPVWTV